MKFTIKKWREMETVAKSTPECATIKKDDDGKVYMWKSSGKRVDAQEITGIERKEKK